MNTIINKEEIQILQKILEKDDDFERIVAAQDTRPSAMGSYRLGFTRKGESDCSYSVLPCRNGNMRLIRVPKDRSLPVSELCRGNFSDIVKRISDPVAYLRESDFDCTFDFSEDEEPIKNEPEITEEVSYYTWFTKKNGKVIMVKFDPIFENGIIFRRHPNEDSLIRVKQENLIKLDIKMTGKLPPEIATMLILVDKDQVRQL